MRCYCVVTRHNRIEKCFAATKRVLTYDENCRFVLLTNRMAFEAREVRTKCGQEKKNSMMRKKYSTRTPSANVTSGIIIAILFCVR